VILALTVLQSMQCNIAGPNLGNLYFNYDLHRAVNYHAGVCISILLQRTLRELLSVIQNHVNHPNRNDWLPVCVAICLLLLGVESLQVDIYLSEMEPLKMIGAMEDNAVKNLVNVFLNSTNQVNPLKIDWNEERNAELVGDDPDLVYAFQDFQELRDEYCKMLIL
jgi:hypothetical protein